MKKTLLLTTALIGNLLILGSVQAQTTITGELKMAYKSVEGFATGSKTNSGFTSERQINFANKGKLNNGLDYVAGFSLEQDGNEDGGSASDRKAIDGTEGNYFNIISGNTTITLGMDHILNGDYAIVPRVGAPMNEEIGVIGGTTVVRTDSRAGLQYSQSLGDNNEFMGLGVVQKIPQIGGTLAVNFVPRVDDAAQTADTAVPVTAVGKSAYSVFFVGDLGVKGLQVALERAQNEKNGANLTDPKVTAFGASYTMGDFSFGAERQKFIDGTKAETETTEFGLTYKINNNASAGIGRIVTEGKTSTGAAKTSDEEIQYLQIGYNLGGFATQLSYIDAENVGYTAANDAQAFVAKIIAKF